MCIVVHFSITRAKKHHGNSENIKIKIQMIIIHFWLHEWEGVPSADF